MLMLMVLASALGAAPMVSSDHDMVGVDANHSVLHEDTSGCTFAYDGCGGDCSNCPCCHLFGPLDSFEIVVPYMRSYEDVCHTLAMSFRPRAPELPPPLI